MRLKPIILDVASTPTLRQIANDFELSVGDRRQRQSLVEAISSARRCQPAELLPYLAEQEVKQVCDLAQVDSKGRKNTLIERLLDASSAEPRPAGGGQPRNIDYTRTFVVTGHEFLGLRPPQTQPDLPLAPDLLPSFSTSVI